MASRALKNNQFSQNVFINCPFDKEYFFLLKPLLFTVISCNLYPRIALERSDSGEVRLQKILELIETSEFSIHDLSRIRSVRAGDYFRLNMPLEIGIDWGCRHYKHAKKSFLVLESEHYSAQRAISDLSGCDFEAHNNSPEELVILVRNWFGSRENKETLPGGSIIWDDYNSFNAELYQKKNLKKKDIDRLPIPELMRYMREWCKQKRSR